MNDEHPCHVVLKARQLGITTFYCIKLLDRVLWEDFVQCGIIAHTLNDVQSIFMDKLKFTFDHLHPGIRPIFKPVGDSAKELRFSHGSTIRVGTSLRSSTLNYLHPSIQRKLEKLCLELSKRLLLVSVAISSQPLRERKGFFTTYAYRLSRRKKRKKS
jgi:hypothetical protein